MGNNGHCFSPAKPKCPKINYRFVKIRIIIPEMQILPFSSSKMSSYVTLQSTITDTYNVYRPSSVRYVKRRRGFTKIVWFPPVQLESDSKDTVPYQRTSIVLHWSSKRKRCDYIEASARKTNAYSE